MKRLLTATRGAVVLGSCVLAACSGRVGDDDGRSGDESGDGVEDDDVTDEGNGGNGGRGGRGGSSGQGGSGGEGGVNPFERNPNHPLSCASTSGRKPGASPVVRLTSAEYNNTLRDLVPGGAALPKQELPLENEIDGFSNNVRAQTASPALVEAYEEGARAAAAKAVAQINELVTCRPTGAEQEKTCGGTFIDTFGARAFRRPLTADESTRLKTFFAGVHTTHGYLAAIETTVAAMLQMPQFLFRTELAGKPDDGAVALTGYEIASRLSYLFWDTMPDAELFAAAKDGKLDTADGVARAAERLMADPRARTVVADFHRQWLDMARIENRAAKKSTSAFPAFTPALGTSMTAATRRFLERIFWDDGARLGALLTDPQAEADKTLAPLYDANVAGAGLETVALDDTKRVGLLGQAGVMAGLAHEGLHSPVLRGVFVLSRLLCAEPNPAPPDANTTLPTPPEGSDIKTTRERFEKLHEVGSCKGCHEIIDGVGFAYEAFDGMGRFRTQENGVDVKTQTAVVGTSDMDATYEGAVPLAQALAKSEQVHQCVVTEWFRYAFSRTPTEEDGCTIVPLTDAFLASGGDMKSLVMELVRSDAFRYRSTLP